MTEPYREVALPVQLFRPRVARPLLRRLFVRWLRAFGSWRSLILLALLLGAVFLFAHFKDPWVCTARIPMEDLDAAEQLGLDRLAVFSPDGQRVAIVQGADGVTIHDAADGRRVAVLPTDGRTAGDVAFSPNGRWLAAIARDDRARLAGAYVWRVATGFRVRTLEGDRYLRRLQFVDGGRQIALVSSAGTLQCGKVDSTEPLRSWTIHHGNPAQPTAIDEARFSADGRWAVALAGDGEFLFFHDAAAGRQTHRHHLGGIGRAAFVRFSADGTRLLVARTGEESFHYFGYRRMPPDDLPAADYRVDMASWLSVWDVPAGTHRYTLAASHLGGLYDAWFTDEGEQIVLLGADGRRERWNDSDQRMIAWETAADPPHSRTRARSPDRRRLLTEADWGCPHVYGLAVCDRREGSLLAWLPGRREGVLHARFGPDGERVLTVTRAGLCRIWQRRWDPSPAGVFASPPFYLVAALAAGLVFSVLGGHRRALGREQVRRLPLGVRAAGGVLGVLGTVFLMDLLGALAAGELVITPMGLAAMAVAPLTILTAVGLLRANRGWRYVAASLLGVGFVVLMAILLLRYVSWGWGYEFTVPPPAVFLLVSVAAVLLLGMGRRIVRRRPVRVSLAALQWLTLAGVCVSLCHLREQLPSPFGFVHAGQWTLYGLPTRAPAWMLDFVLPGLMAVTAWLFVVLVFSPAVREAFRKGPAPPRWARWRRVGGRLGGFSIRTAVLGVLLVGSGIVFGHWKDPWVCELVEHPPSPHRRYYSQAMDLSRDGRVAAIARRDGVGIYDLQAGRWTHRLEGVGGWLDHVALSPDGRYVATAELDADRSVTLLAHDLTTGRRRVLAETAAPCRFFGFSPDSTCALITPGQGFLEVHELATGRRLHRRRIGRAGARSPRADPRPVWLEPAFFRECALIDRKTVLAMEREVYWPILIRLDTQDPPVDLRNALPSLAGESAYMIPSLSPDGKALLTLQRTTTAVVRVWEADSLKFRWEARPGESEAGPSSIEAWRWSPDSKQIAVLSCGPAGVWPTQAVLDWSALDVYDAASGRPPRGAPGRFVRPFYAGAKLAWTADGRPAVFVGGGPYGAGGLLTLDLTTGEWNSRIPLEADLTRDVCLSPLTGHVLVEGAVPGGEREISLWRQRGPLSVVGVLGAPAFWPVVPLAALFAWSLLRDVKRRQGPQRLGELPRRLRAVAVSFAVLGVIGVIGTVTVSFAPVFVDYPQYSGPLWCHFWWTVMVNWTAPVTLAACLPIGLGLRRRSRGAWVAAVCWTWAAAAFLMWPMSHVIGWLANRPELPVLRTDFIFGQPLTWPTVLFLLVPPATLLLVACQILVLHGARVRRLMGSTAAPVSRAAPSA